MKEDSFNTAAYALGKVKNMKIAFIYNLSKLEGTREG